MNVLPAAFAHHCSSADLLPRLVAPLFCFRNRPAEKLVLLAADLIDALVAVAIAAFVSHQQVRGAHAGVAAVRALGWVPLFSHRPSSVSSG